jgi:hypothetical protein
VFFSPSTADCWRYWQAARRAPAVPVPQETCVICGSDEPYTGTCGSNDPRALCKKPAPHPPEAAQLDDTNVVDMAQAVDSTEAAPVQLPEPVAYLYHDAPTLDDYIANERAGIPINSACIGVKRMPHCRNETPLYTEQQVRQLLAAHGIEVAP